MLCFRQRQDFMNYSRKLVDGSLDEEDLDAVDQESEVCVVRPSVSVCLSDTTSHMTVFCFPNL